MSFSLSGLRTESARLGSMKSKWAEGGHSLLWYKALAIQEDRGGRNERREEGEGKREEGGGMWSTPRQAQKLWFMASEPGPLQVAYQCREGQQSPKPGGL